MKSSDLLGVVITSYSNKENLNNEWHLLDKMHYGKDIDWNEKHFRFKAVENGKLVGTIDGKHESGIVYIGTIITAKSARGKGIGTMLIKKAEEFGKKYGAHRTWLSTGKDWSENIFYKKLGFKLIGTLYKATSLEGYAYIVPRDITFLTVAKPYFFK
jgi:GNAT superfamily N-acetyltransferase